MSENRSSTSILLIFIVTLAAGARTLPAQYAPPPPGVQAQQFAGEVTVTATGVETEVDEAPTAVTVITRDEIDDAQAGSVGEMLRRVPGLTVVGSGDQGKVTSIFTRGTGSNQTLVMLDGVRLNSPYFGGFDWSRLSTAGLRQVEVARGPYSALWGADAVGGVINHPARPGAKGLQRPVLRRGRERRVAAAGGRHRLGQQGLRHLRLGFRRQKRRQPGQLRFLDDSDSWSPPAGASADRGSRIGVIVQDLEGETGIPFAAPGQPDSRTAGKTANRPWWPFPSTSISATRGISNSPARPWTAPSISRTRTTPFSHIRTPRPHPPRSASPATTAFPRHTFSWGGEWREEEVTDASNYGTTLDRATIDVTSFFVQDVWTMSPKLRLLLGVRWDDSDPWGSETSPRADLGWKISDTLELRAGYGEAFRPPSLGELYFPFSGNADLLPETSQSTDVGLTYTTANRKSKWQVTAFSDRSRQPHRVRLRHLRQRQHRFGHHPRRRALLGLSSRASRRLLCPGHLPRHRRRPRTAAAAAARVERLMDPPRRLFETPQRRPHRDLRGHQGRYRPGDVRTQPGRQLHDGQPRSRLQPVERGRDHRQGAQHRRFRLPGGPRLRRPRGDSTSSACAWESTPMQGGRKAPDTRWRGSRSRSLTIP